MSWWSDKERFDEYDPPWCENCKGGTSKKECDECSKRHRDDGCIEIEVDDETDRR